MPQTASPSGIFSGGKQIPRAVQRELLWALWGGFTAALVGTAAAYARHRQVERTIAELKSLSNHMLSDIGIERHDIERVVRYGRDATELRK